MKFPVILFVLIIAFLSSCKDDSNVSVVQDTNILLTISDKAGNDLLDTAYSGNILDTDIKIYYLNGGTKTLFNQSNLDYPNGYQIIYITENFGNNQPVNRFGMRIYSSDKLYQKDGDQMSTTYVQINDTTELTFDCQVKTWGQSKQITEVKLDGKEVWTQSSGSERLVDYQL